MNKNRIMVGILLAFSLAPSISFGFEMPIVPPISPPACFDSQDNVIDCWSSGTPAPETRSWGEAPTMTGELSVAKFKEVIGGAYSQLIKIAKGLSNWVGNIFRK